MESNKLRVKRKHTVANGPFHVSHYKTRKMHGIHVERFSSESERV